MSFEARSMFRSRCFSMRLMARANFFSERSLAVTYRSIARAGSVPIWPEGTCMAGRSISGSNGRIRPRVETRSRIICRWVGLVACELFQFERIKKYQTGSVYPITRIYARFSSHRYSRRACLIVRMSASPWTNDVNLKRLLRQIFALRGDMAQCTRWRIVRSYYSEPGSFPHGKR